MPRDMTGMSLAGSGNRCEIRFDTKKISPDSKLVSETENTISERNLDIKLDVSAFGEGLIVLIIGVIVGTAYVVRDIILDILSRLERSRI